MRNIFDQYSQTENRLTHALVWTLKNERRLIRPFLSWIGIKGVPSTRPLHITEQRIPGTVQIHNEQESSGLPDAIIYTDDGWAVLIESKVEASPKVGQLRRHRETARRHGFDKAQVALLTVENPCRPLPDFVLMREWREVYAWFRGRSGRAKSEWPLHLTEFLEVLESQAEEDRIKLKGTLTMFDGFHFNKDHPYTYNEAKRLLRLFRAEVLKGQELRSLDVDRDAPGRKAITGKDSDYVWDFLQLKRSHKQAHTKFPHLTMSVHRERLIAAVTIPHGVRGGIKRKVGEVGRQGFTNLIQKVEANLRQVVKISPKSQPAIYVLQRHYKSQRSAPITDGRLDTDLRTCAKGNEYGIKYQPEWIDAAYMLLLQKQSNIQLGLEMRFDYSCPRVRSPRAVDLFTSAWSAMEPVLDLFAR